MLYVAFAALSGLIWGVGDFAGGKATQRAAVLPVVWLSKLVSLPLLAVYLIAMYAPFTAVGLAWGGLAHGRKSPCSDGQKQAEPSFDLKICTTKYVETDGYPSIYGLGPRIAFAAMADPADYYREIYARGLAGLPLALPVEREHAGHVYHLYVVRTSERDALAAFLKERGIQTGIHYPVPAHRQPAVERLAPPALPRTERLVHEILSLPMSASHTDAEIDTVIAAVRAFFGRSGDG